MKRLVCLLLCAALMLGAAPALAAGVSDVMRVVNCQEWVSLREAPETQSKRLAKVYLGELVTDCIASINGFIQCEFDGKMGYILQTYLKTTDYSLGESFPGNQMVVNCSEWVSMREGPDPSSKQLVKVPLGAIVTSCVAYLDSYILCEYKSYKGYISTTYLKKANYSVSSQDQSVVNKSEGKYPPITGPMVVVNCNDWVSLREKASTSAARLARVPLGAQVTGCVQVSDSFIYCSYGGLWGYIHVDYLSEPEGNEPGFPIESGFSDIPYLPSMDEFSTAPGYELLAETNQGYTIVVRTHTGENQTEMMAVCYNPSGAPQWELRDSSPFEPADWILADAFIGGVPEDPLLIWYVAGKGFFAYEYGPLLKMRWTLPMSEPLPLSDALARAVDTDGVLYLAFEDEAMSISQDGQLRWRTSCDDPNIYRPSTIEIGDYYFDVTYENFPDLDNVVTVVRFSKDGFLLMNTVKVISSSEGDL